MRKFVGAVCMGAALMVGAASDLRSQEKAPMTEAEKQKLLAEMAQNPVANMMSFPFQLNSSYGLYGADGRTQNILNIQPVLPFHLKGGNWNVITRTIFPVVWQPDYAPTGMTSGLGSVNFTAFLSPAVPKGLIWGAGPTINFPSTDAALGSRNWSAGPALVLLKIEGKLVFGGVFNNTWSFAGPSGAPSTNLFYSQVFINYNLPQGWYLTTAPVITANWYATSEADVWTVPVGGGFGKIQKIGRLPFNLQLSAYGYATKPAGGPNWTLRTNVALLLPKM
jgi:hypothetical protein